MWHDRAVFHFLTTVEERAAYVQQVAKSVKSGGHVLVSAFGPERPTRCTGLDVVRCDTGPCTPNSGTVSLTGEPQGATPRTVWGQLSSFSIASAGWNQAAVGTVSIVPRRASDGLESALRGGAPL